MTKLASWQLSGSHVVEMVPVSISKSNSNSHSNCFKFPAPICQSIPTTCTIDSPVIKQSPKTSQTLYFKFDMDGFTGGRWEWGIKHLIMRSYAVSMLQNVRFEIQSKELVRRVLLEAWDENFWLVMLAAILGFHFRKWKFTSASFCTEKASTNYFKMSFYQFRNSHCRQMMMVTAICINSDSHQLWCPVLSHFKYSANYSEMERLSLLWKTKGCPFSESHLLYQSVRCSVLVNLIISMLE